MWHHYFSTLSSLTIPRNEINQLEMSRSQIADADQNRASHDSLEEFSHCTSVHLCTASHFSVAIQVVVY